MRAVVQRVLQATVSVVEAGTLTEAGAIGSGLLVLIGVREDDTQEDALWLAEKVVHLRIFEDEAGKMNRSLQDVQGAALIVSNFTLYGDCRKGRRPSFTEAASGDQAETLYQRFASLVAEAGVPSQRGVFGAEMQVLLINDGPVTLLLDSRRAF